MISLVPAEGFSSESSFAAGGKMCEVVKVTCAYFLKYFTCNNLEFQKIPFQLSIYITLVW